LSKVLFRADAYPEIGTGDLLSLVYFSRHLEMLGVRAHFLCKDTNSSRKICSSKQVSATFFPKDYDLEQECEVIKETLIKSEAQALFFEITDECLTAYGSLPEDIFLGCVCFDGKVDNRFHFLVDWGIQASEQYQGLNSTRKFLGPEFVFLDPNYFSQNVVSDVNRIVVTMGGADEWNVTRKILQCLKNESLDVDVVLGPGYTQKASLKPYLNQELRVNIHDSPENLFSLFQEARLVISAGGLTSSELLAMGKSTVLIATYEHQIERCKFFDRIGASNYIGYKEFSCETLKKIIKEPPSFESGFEIRTPYVASEFLKEWRNYDRSR